MWISQLKMSNIRSFTDFDHKFNNGINLFIGNNNTGKSTILKALYSIQDFDIFSTEDLRKSTNNGNIQVFLENITNLANTNSLRIVFNYNKQNRNGPIIADKINDGHQFSAPPWKDTAPDNLIFPFFSKRKHKNYAQIVDEKTTKAVMDDFSNIVSIIDSIIGTDLPMRNEFVESCKDVLGYEISKFSHGSGSDIGLTVEEYNNIRLENMGEGVIQLLGLLSILCRTKDKIIMIEEPENDLHPSALKKILDKIVEKSNTNQFFITTHSNIVAKYLGKAKDVKLFNLKSTMSGRVPLSTLDEVTTSEGRIKVLEDLGYELQDFDIWEGWLFLEESTAERMIREYFIPIYAPKLNNRLKTVSCMSNSHVGNRFEAFYSNFLYTHLTPVYEDKAWVIIDGDTKGKEIVEGLRKKYKKWAPEHFDYFIMNAFEYYYPEKFKDEVKKVLEIKDYKSACEEKTKLLVKVLEWIAENKDDAKKHFETAAKDVIEKLVKIETKLFN